MVHVKQAKLLACLPGGFSRSSPVFAPLPIEQSHMRHNFERDVKLNKTQKTENERN